jgi:hypothetical protein
VAVGILKLESSLPGRSAMRNPRQHLYLQPDIAFVIGLTAALTLILSLLASRPLD